MGPAGLPAIAHRGPGHARVLHARGDRAGSGIEDGADPGVILRTLRFVDILLCELGIHDEPLRGHGGHPVESGRPAQGNPFGGIAAVGADVVDAHR